MASPLLLWLPLAVLAVLAIVGAGTTRLLARRFPVDAQIALAAPVGAAIFVCASPALHLGIPPSVIAAAIVLGFGGLTVATIRGRAGVATRHAAAPVAVALVALLVTATPWLARGDWDAAGIATTDPYLWVSQAKAYLDGPAPSPASDYPDRLAVERVDALHWPVGLPFGVSSVALLGGRDPANVYGAWAVALAALLALAVYAAARGCLQWSQGYSIAAGAMLATNALVLYSTLNGWQAQVALTVFGTLAITTYRMALDRDATRGEPVLAGGFFAAALATYGFVAGPFLVMAVAVVAGYVVSHRSFDGRRIVSASAGAAAATVAIGFVPLVRSLRQLAIGSQITEGTEWETYARGLAVEAVGLVPRIGTTYRPPLEWTVLATIAGVGVFAFALMSLRRAGHARADVLLSVGGGAIVGISAMSALGANPYMTLKLAGYAAPLVTLLALAGVIGATRFPRTRFAVFAVASFWFAASTAVVYEQARSHSVTLEEVRSATASHERLPRGARVGIALRDPWEQAWAVYFLRDRKVTVVEPTIYLTGFGLRSPRLSREPYEYAVDVHPRSRGTDGDPSRSQPILIRKARLASATLP